MGSQDILDYLKQCKTPQTRKQIADAIEYSPERVSKLINKLLRYGDIYFKEYDSLKAQKKVNYKLVRRTKFYFIKS